MLRIIEVKILDKNVRYIEGSCLSTDTKPTKMIQDGNDITIATGSLIQEADTGDVYVFDETSSGTWSKIGG